MSPHQSNNPNFVGGEDLLKGGFPALPTDGDPLVLGRCAGLFPRPREAHGHGGRANWSAERRGTEVTLPS